MMVTIPYRPRGVILPFHATKRRFRVLIIHRRFGKTVAAINHLIKQATTPPKVLARERKLKDITQEKINEWEQLPRLFAFIAPFYSQAKAIAWEMLKFYSMAIPGITINESELRIDYPGGGRVRLFGADNGESLRGLKFWEVVLDEFQDHSPDFWREVLLPACFDTQAPITFLGTIKGKNHLYKLWEEHQSDADWFCMYLPVNKSGVLDPEFLEKEKIIMGDAKFNQEYMLEPYASIEGAVFGREMAWLRQNGRITDIPFDNILDVDTFWDLGMNDYLVVWFFQRIGSQRRVIDCFATHNTGLKDVVPVLAAKGYFYGTHYLPHDAKVRDLNEGITRENYLKARLQGNFQVVPRVRRKEDAIDATRMHYQKLWFSSKLDVPIEALCSYAYEMDEKKKVWTNLPKHDWTSHYADGLMTWAVSETQLSISQSLPQEQNGYPMPMQESYDNDDLKLY